VRGASGLAAATFVVWGGLVACADAAPGRDAPAPIDPGTASRSPTRTAPRPPDAAAPPSERGGSTASPAAATVEAPAAPIPSAALAGRGSDCVRGGSTREEVLEIMGQPDSVAFGAYVYGRSQVLFGYGVVVEWSNAGGNLLLC